MMNFTRRSCGLSNSILQSSKCAVVNTHQRLFSVDHPNIRSISDLYDIGIKSLLDITNASFASKSKYVLQLTTALNSVPELKTKPLQSKRISLVFSGSPSSYVDNLNIVRVLRRCGADVTITSLPQLKALATKDKPKDKNAPKASKRKGATSLEDVVALLNSQSDKIDLVLFHYTDPKYDHADVTLNLNIPNIALQTPTSSVLSTVGLLQSLCVSSGSLASLFNSKLAFIGVGNAPHAYDLYRASQMFEFHLSVGTSAHLKPVPQILDPILAVEHERVVDPQGKTVKSAPSTAFEVTSHPFIACALADHIVTDTVVPHLSWTGAPCPPLKASMLPYEFDREMMSVAKDTVKVAHFTGGYHDWTCPPLGLEDPRCLWDRQMIEENYALVSLCLWALNKQDK